MQTLMENSLFAFALIVLGFGFLIFVHELGHFVVAKLVGIKTTQFAIGFGHSLLTWRKGLGFRVGTTEPEYEQRIKDAYKAKCEADGKTDPAPPTVQQTDQIAAELGLGETEYRLNYIPLGGYVKMLGQEDMDPSARSEDPRAFNNKSVSARFAVISAGVIMNVIFGMIFFIIAFMSGVKFPPAVVGEVAIDSPAAVVYAQGHENDPAYLGLQPEDHITHINGKEIDDMMDVKYAIILSNDETKLDMTVERPGAEQTLHYVIQPVVNETSGLYYIGIDSPLDLKVNWVVGGSDAEAAGVMKNMVMTAVDGQPVERYSQYSKLVSAAQGKPVTVTISDPESDKQIEMEIEAWPLLVAGADKDTPANLLGLVPPTMISDVVEGSVAEEAGFKQYDIIESINGHSWPDPKTVVETTKTAHEDDNIVSLILLRDQERIETGPIKLNRKGKLGIAMNPSSDNVIIADTLPDSPVNTHGKLVSGSKLVSLNGEPVESWVGFQRELTNLAAQDDQAEVELTYALNLPEHPQETVKVALTPQVREQLAKARWAALLPDGIGVDLLREPVVRDNPMQAAALGFKKTHQWITNTYMTLVRLFQMTVPADQLSGPLGIVHQGTIFARGGWQYLLYFLGLISINLAVINFLPIPITDGGQAVFLAIEKVKGSPVSVGFQTAATVVGLVLLLCVFIFVTYNDIARLVG